MANRKKAYAGPFWGLNTTARPRDLGPAWAVDAQNVLLHDGRIRPAWPFTPFGPSDIPWPTSDWPTPAIISAYHWDSPAAGQIVVFQIEEVVVGQPQHSTLYAAHPDGTLVHLGGDLAVRPATYVVAYEQLYVLAGDRSYKTDGSPEGTLRIGIPPPMLGQADLEQIAAGPDEPVLPEGSYQYALTAYDASRDVESNPFTFADALTIGAGLSYRARIHLARWGGQPIPPDRGVTDVRLYRRDVHLGYPFFLLRTTKSWPRSDALEDPVGTRADPIPGEGSVITGPFAPSKNGVPPRATIGALYKDRMFYNDAGASRSDLLYYSGFGHPDHVDPDDFVTLEGDPERGVTGMTELAGQLCLLKPRSIWILSGAITGATNETIATGAAPPQSSHLLYRTKAQAGCANRGGGNGAILVGDPPRLHYNGEAGLYAFDGVDEVNVGKAIIPTWRAFARHGDDLQAEKNQALTYGVDAVNQILFIANGAQPFGDPEILCYHYARTHAQGEQRLGAWTYLRSESQRKRYRCVATTLGDVIAHQPGAEAGFYSPVLVGTETGDLLLANDRATEERIPTFRYESPPLRIMEGQLAHIFQVTWLHDRVVDVEQRPRSLEFGFRSDRLAEFQLETRTTRSAIHQHQRVARETAELALRVQTPTPMGLRTMWHPDLGIVGWVIEYEPAGGD